ncbi:bifunctional proline dehydrogenase/L-glutamate gamma-semialdehyde dehydrogenase PutA [Rhodovulum euryhalinum]|uniref:Bifunctional protein PutA n=1 Tax=Rhodovulum euryhalinum TaxID=35805 RepID=A0A4R2KE79_9RHOB|nr:bifunctional proline dehydrogenase/L-glutamate gamma-semialdehyde dehydrogenase PutA [Rhodovulum euryhalinum]TCO71911.1 L-proline dehydrogenase /delta-1-pyrroline-5-carboxylate dehydrogenase [Rhodovulum euryhalinum]
MTDRTTTLRTGIEAATYAPEGPVLKRLLAGTGLDAAARTRISAAAAALVRDIRAHDRPGLMEVFLAEYGLSTEEGVALMCLAEALLRVPDAETMDALIEDKIAPSDWGRHLGKSASPLVNASTWALMLTGRVLDDPQPGLAATLKGALRRLGEPVIRTAVARAMREMGRQFVLGETIGAAMDRAAGMEAKGYTYSYDMLGEAARTEDDASRYLDAYAQAIARIAGAATADDIRDNPGISIKLSALHPRYEVAQRDRAMAELAPRLLHLALMAREAGMGLNIDAEEADRLALSLDVIEAVLADPRLAGWHGFGVVVQAYGPRAGLVLDWLHALADRHDRRLMVRLVKGAYWDTEIKRAQVIGVDGFPVFTRKAATDVSYIANARKMLGMTDRIYPQFATHNAHTVAAILDMGADRTAFEFQRLHGMGETLHDLVMARHDGARCRIYAPVGAHRDLLAYLVRRLLENGANSSFVNRIVDEDVPPETVAADPLAEIEAYLDAPEHPAIRRAPALFAPERRNSRGWDLAHAPDLAAIEAARAPHRAARFEAAPLIAGTAAPETAQAVLNPADPADIVGHVRPASTGDVDTALAAARPWDAPAAARAAILRRAADLYEDHFGAIFAIVAREAGKTLPDAVGELREAVDFLRYYAAQAETLDTPPRGVFACISPWNFPLAIFTGQVTAALAAGNAVLAKPAEQTPLIAHYATRLLHEAGVPRDALQLLPGDGATVGARLTADPRVNGVAFTGATETARIIARAMADHMAPGTPLIAETGGLNAMVVDSTALPEQAVRDVVTSAFQSAGQRCSALRCLYVQEDIAEGFLKMLTGAMAELRLGDPWDLSTDIGPLIEAAALRDFTAHVAQARTDGRLLWQAPAPATGHFLSPALIRVDGIAALEREIFGPVLHVATFRAEHLDRVIDAINARGYGLTFGLHSRIDDRVQHIAERLAVGNAYVNRNQIGAVVGCQPFGGEGLSGTGPKAGGANYLPRFTARPAPKIAGVPEGTVTAETLARALREAAPGHGPDSRALPGPTGESNRLSTHPRPPLLCLGPGRAAAQAQTDAVRALGGAAVAVTGTVAPDMLETLDGFAGVLWWGDSATGRAIAQALARRGGPLVPLVTGLPDTAHARHERHLCIDTTASGGNAALLAEVGSA